MPILSLVLSSQFKFYGKLQKEKKEIYKERKEKNLKQS